MSSIYDPITVDAIKAAKVLDAVIKSGSRAMLWGKPGVGKTSLVHQAAERSGLFDSVIVFNPSQDDVIDMKLPYVDSMDVDGRTHSISRFAFSERLPVKGRHLIFVDEINTAQMAMQATLYSLILEGRIGSYRLPPGCVRMAAGNRLEDKCAANDMSVALRDRLGVHINVVASEKAWLEWAIKQGISPQVTAFVRNFPSCLDGTHLDDPSGGCTPRSLEELSNMLTSGIDPDVLQVTCNGIIGAGFGTEFVGFLDIYRNNVDVEDILKNPMTATLHTRTDIMYAIATAVGAKIDENTIDNALKYFGRLNDRRYAIMAMQDAYRRNPKIMNSTTAGKNFVVTNYKYFV